MNPLNLIILSRYDYEVLVLLCGLGWGLFFATLTAALLIDRIKWHKRILGQ